MKNACIGVFDSGIGGVSVLCELVKIFPKNKFVYFGDNLNAPYGNKSKRELKWLAFNGIMRLTYFNPQVIVIACNTISVNCLYELKRLFDIKLVGIFPPVESELLKNKKVLLLSTVKTAEQYKSKNLKGLKVIGLKNLVRDIENNLNDLSNIQIENGYKNCFYIYDSIILGCTHYFFVKNNILDHFCPQKSISGINGTINQIKQVVKSYFVSKNIRKYQVIFIDDKNNRNKTVFNKIMALEYKN